MSCCGSVLGVESGWSGEKDSDKSTIGGTFPSNDETNQSRNLVLVRTAKKNLLAARLMMIHICLKNSVMEIRVWTMKMLREVRL